MTIAHNRFQNNRARSLLIKTFGKVRIHDNAFHAPGPAILISAGLSNWYESGPVDDIAIFNNVFDQCNFGDWGDGVIVVAAALADPSSNFPVMRNIRIHGNEISRGSDYPFHANEEGDFVFGPGVTKGKWEVNQGPAGSAAEEEPLR